ncbi:hypothetical protein [Streptomyces gobiensis]|uniref:hypothetical protein n=1 Tax=Streptomyces gobiensis TaxID=2875706 RepID=UPI001E309290|nr:hypothetical protein [Streptomyces gobiensis]UGY92856.1 hypothetical protein test1122_14845 [Streptomyces gobiensis]
MPEPDTLPQDEHQTSTTERGSFVSASCSCGWHGPARRARGKAREDASAHTHSTGAE